MSDIANPWFGQIASLVEQSLHRHGYSLMLCNSAEDADLEREYLQLLPAKGIDGLIIVPVQRTRKSLVEALPPDLPLVVLDRPVPGINDNPVIIGCLDEIPMMHLLPIPIVCSVQDVPRLAEGCVSQLLPQLMGEKTLIEPITLPASVVANEQFRVRQFVRRNRGTRVQA